MAPDHIKKDILRKRSALDRYKRALIKLTKAGIILEGSLKLNLMDDELIYEYKLSRESLIRHLGYKLVYPNNGGHPRWRELERTNANMVQVNQTEAAK